MTSPLLSLKPLFASAALLLLALTATGCMGPLFNIGITGEQTTLEQQVLGTYSQLGSDLTIYSSVRGVDPQGNLQLAPERTDSQQATFLAMRNREYNRDDVSELLAAGVVGEAGNGLLDLRQSPSGTTVSLSPLEAEAVIEEENRDRAVILERLLTTTPGVRREDAAQVRWIFASLNQELAPQGSLIQTQDGSWRQK